MINTDAIKYGTLSELEIMEKEAQETLEAIKKEKAYRNRNTSLGTTLARVKELVDNNKDKYLFIKEERNNTGPQCNIIRLQGSSVVSSLENYIEVVPRFEGFSHYQSKDVSNCYCQFFSTEYSSIYFEIDKWNKILENPSEVIKDKEYVKVFLDKVCSDHVKSVAKELVTDSLREFDITIINPITNTTK